MRRGWHGRCSSGCDRRRGGRCSSSTPSDNSRRIDANAAARVSPSWASCGASRWTEDADGPSGRRGSCHSDSSAGSRLDGRGRGFGHRGLFTVLCVRAGGDRGARRGNSGVGGRVSGSRRCQPLCSIDCTGSRELRSQWRCAVRVKPRMHSHASEPLELQRIERTYAAADRFHRQFIAT